MSSCCVSGARRPWSRRRRQCWGSWRAELDERFGLTFEILYRAYVARSRRERGFGVNPLTTHSRFLVSHNLLGDLQPGSLLILDEAHHAAPSSGGRYGIETKFTRAVRDLGGRFEHRLFLSATPHNGHSNSFSTLLELLDPYRFTRGVRIKGRRELEAVWCAATPCASGCSSRPTSR